MPAVRRDSDDNSRATPRNWVLLLSLVLCIEFWIVATTTIAQSL
jgi:hypothetical protein